ncbi:MAG: hypothetical protein KGM24_11620, partial [Elusimicrobia bacterium]|nr:hypothetical protein [Elusimicrobiota bacterium]
AAAAAVASSAAAAFGHAAVADLPGAVLVVASPAPIVRGDADLEGNLTLRRPPEPGDVRLLGAGLRWRPAPAGN